MRAIYRVFSVGLASGVQLSLYTYGILAESIMESCITHNVTKT